ncbi:polymorphic toxin-type HINT domain-containing protein [Pedobacter nototheniae]|uniref:polymorphic toxin-type HINT domain-containing protein n=1 Tax=Pedobacter nototheniae TaxID=2488994 RepID=UPI00103B651F|nr:polymorphic toxin-type HINT domain-containing protein [Pedobacter nototheniae]
MEDLEYIVAGALTHCNKGLGVMPIMVTSNTNTHIQKQLVATELDKTYMVNISNYGMCATTQKPCNPMPIQWTGTYEQVKVNGAHPLIATSCLSCGVDPTSKIEFITSGQLKLRDCLPPESIEAINEANKAANEASDEYDLERASVGESGFWEGFIPVWGSGRDYIHCIQTKHYWKAAGNLGLVALDIITLGADELVIGAVKGGAKGLAEAGGKMALKKIAAIIAAKETAIALAKKLGTGIAKFSIEKFGLCIAKACFAAGTFVQTRYGPKNIEDLVSGDEVWAFNEETGETGLQPILNVFEHETDTIVELTVDGEVISTTPEHPFYANSQWKEAGLLQQGDTIQLFNGKAAIVQNVIYKFDEALQPTDSNCDNEQPYKRTTVYNIEVQGWHTFFIGLLWLLVHNGACLYQLAKAGVQWAKNILNGQLFDKAMSKVYALSQVHLANGKVLDAMVAGKEIISHKFTQLSEINYDTAKGYIDEIWKKYADQMTKSSKLKEQVSTSELKKILEIPPQAKGIPADVAKYAEEAKVEIREISGEALETYNNTKFW